MSEEIEDAPTFEILASLPSAEGYDSGDRYRDFRRVLLGSDEGRQVLRELLSWCHLHRPSFHGHPLDPYGIVRQEAERNLGLRLIHTLTVPPKEKPQQAQRTTR